MVNLPEPQCGVSVTEIHDKYALREWCELDVLTCHKREDSEVP